RTQATPLLVGQVGQTGPVAAKRLEQVNSITDAIAERHLSSVTRIPARPERRDGRTPPQGGRPRFCNGLASGWASAAATAWSLGAGAALLSTGSAVLGSLVSVRMALGGFPRVVPGVVMSAYFAGFVLGSLYAFRIITRVGFIRAFAAFAATA